MASTIGVNIATFLPQKVPRWIIPTATGIMLIAYSWSDQSRRKAERQLKTVRAGSTTALTHELKEGSAEFIEFFQRWYSDSSIRELHVFCTDLKWANANAIERALENKAARLHLYLMDHDDPVALKLARQGAKVLRVKARVQSTVRFSLIRDHDSIERLIYRDKGMEPNRGGGISFIETTAYQNPQLLALVNDFLELCHD